MKVKIKEWKVRLSEEEAIELSDLTQKNLDGFSDKMKMIMRAGVPVKYVKTYINGDHDLSWSTLESCSCQKDNEGLWRIYTYHPDPESDDKVTVPKE